MIPPAFASDWSSNILANLNIGLTGQVRVEAKAPADVRPLAEVSSVPVYELTAKSLLDSDNLISDSLLLAMAEKEWGNGAGFNQGVAVMTQALEDMGIELSRTRLEDGSGLSRYNLLSAEVLNKLLAQMHADPQLRPLIAALPVAGKSGTLAYKPPYNRAPLKSRVTAKTGSMGGVDNLAGYFSVAGKDYSFVVLENGLTSEGKATQTAWHGTILLAVIQQLESRARKEGASPQGPDIAGSSAGFKAMSYYPELRLNTFSMSCSSPAVEPSQPHKKSVHQARFQQYISVRKAQQAYP